MGIDPKQMLKKTQNLQRELEMAKKLVLSVGLPKEKIGGRAYGNGASVIMVGAIHEFGGTFNHPGGTAYGYRTKSDAKKHRITFLKGGQGYKVLGKTKPHRITMPQRSFLRMPFLLKADEIETALADQFKSVKDGKLSAKIALGRVGVVAVNISKRAFVTRGYGKWKPSKKKSGMTLIDKSILRNSITWVVK